MGGSHSSSAVTLHMYWHKAWRCNQFISECPSVLPRLGCSLHVSVILGVAGSVEHIMPIKSRRSALCMKSLV
jgi:hypothetical protein